MQSRKQPARVGCGSFHFSPPQQIPARLAVSYKSTAAQYRVYYCIVTRGNHHTDRLARHTRISVDWKPYLPLVARRVACRLMKIIYLDKGLGAKANHNMYTHVVIVIILCIQESCYIANA